MRVSLWSFRPCGCKASQGSLGLAPVNAPQMWGPKFNLHGKFRSLSIELEMPIIGESDTWRCDEPCCALCLSHLYQVRMERNWNHVWTCSASQTASQSAQINQSTCAYRIPWHINARSTRETLFRKTTISEANLHLSETCATILCWNTNQSDVEVGVISLQMYRKCKFGISVWLCFVPLLHSLFDPWTAFVASLQCNSRVLRRVTWTELSLWRQTVNETFRSQSVYIRLRCRSEEITAATRDKSINSYKLWTRCLVACLCWWQGAVIWSSNKPNILLVQRKFTERRETDPPKEKKNGKFQRNDFDPANQSAEQNFCFWKALFRCVLRLTSKKIEMQCEEICEWNFIELFASVCEYIRSDQKLVAFSNSIQTPKADQRARWFIHFDIAFSCHRCSGLCFHFDEFWQQNSTSWGPLFWSYLATSLQTFVLFSSEAE